MDEEIKVDLRASLILNLSSHCRELSKRDTEKDSKKERHRKRENDREAET